MFFRRRKFLFSLLLLAVGFAKKYSTFPFVSIASAAPAIDILNSKKQFPFQSIESFLGKTATYDISFLWFEKAAVATFKVEREHNGYRATLEGETKGFVGFLTSYRRHRYISYFDYLPEIKKFRTSSFERNVTIGKHKEKSKTVLDYESRSLSWKTTKDKKTSSEGTLPIPEGIEYEDILSAFFNFRSGSYGSIERGRTFSIQTIPSEGQSLIEVNIATKEEANADKDLYGRDYNEDLLYIKIKVPKEIFKSATGEVSIWIDETVIPVRGVVKDYIGFGDMTGILRKNT